MYYDCYVLTPTRTRELAYSYLNTFAPDREALSDVYEVPFLGKVTTHEFDTADRLIDYLISNPAAPFSISWRNRDRSIGLHNIDLHFTDDGHLILGLSCIADDALADQWLKRIMDFCGEPNGYITLEEPPPLNSEAFLAIVANLK